MLERIIRFAIDHRWLMLALTLALIGVGAWSFRQLPIDATPDITNVQVQINTEAGGYSPLESEQRVTFPIEGELNITPRSSGGSACSRRGRRRRRDRRGSRCLRDSRTRPPRSCAGCGA